MRTLNDLDAIAEVGWNFGGIADDQPDLLSALDHVLEHLMADCACGGSNNNHVDLPLSCRAEARLQ